MCKLEKAYYKDKWHRVSSLTCLNKVEAKLKEQEGGRLSIFERLPIDVIRDDLEVLKILKDKEVAIDELKHCMEMPNSQEALDEYNAFAGDENALTMQEFIQIQKTLEAY